MANADPNVGNGASDQTDPALDAAIPPVEGARSADAASVDAAIRARLTPEQRQVVARCLWVLGLLSTGSMIGLAFSLYLVNAYPLLLIGLSPIGRHLMLVAPTVDPLAFVAVGSLRRLAFYFASFHLGRAMGPLATIWLEARFARAARFIHWLERLFSRAPNAVVVLLPGPGVATLAGMSKMSAPVYIPLVALGLVFRMVLIVIAAEWLREPIQYLLELANEYKLPGTIVLVSAIAIYRWWQSRRKARGALTPP